jgi:serine/threonine protein phosphatase PrpC
MEQKFDIHNYSTCGKRDKNEDAYNIITNINNKNKSLAPINFFSIFDGHGGKGISKILSDVMPKIFLKKYYKYPLSISYIMKIFQKIQKFLKTKYSKHSTHSGSTSLNVCMFLSNTDIILQIINLGDSRCVMCNSKNIAVPLTKDHKPFFPDEKSRIEKLGGKITYDGDYRIGDLSVSRSFGDVDNEPYISSIPDVYKYKIKNDKFIIIACDGLWDVMSNQDVVNYILLNYYDSSTNKRINKRNNIAKQLVEHAVHLGSTDNITILIIFF